MTKRLQLAAVLCGALVLGLAGFGSEAKAWRASRTWVGPYGGSVTWHGYRGPYRYRGAVTVRTPDGRTYRRVTNVYRGPYGTYATRRWVGPYGGVYWRGWGRRWY